MVKWTCIICMHSKLFPWLLIKALLCESQVFSRAQCLQDFFHWRNTMEIFLKFPKVKLRQHMLTGFSWVVSGIYRIRWESWLCKSQRETESNLKAFSKDAENQPLQSQQTCLSWPVENAFPAQPDSSTKHPDTGWGTVPEQAMEKQKLWRQCWGAQLRQDWCWGCPCCGQGCNAGAPRAPVPLHTEAPTGSANPHPSREWAASLILLCPLRDPKYGVDFFIIHFLSLSVYYRKGRKY